MTERGALLWATGLHLLLLAAMSLGLARSLPASVADADITPIEFVAIGAPAQPAALPQPSAGPAPQAIATVAPALPADADLREAEPVDTAPQDSAPAEPRSPAGTGFDPGALAVLIDKARPKDAAKARNSAPSAKVSPIAVASLEQAIRSQIAPCWNPPIGGADVKGMTALLRIRLNRDGSVAAIPEFLGQTGATAGNEAYARAFVDTARRAVLRCAPFILPDDLYPTWREIELNFDPRLMT